MKICHYMWGNNIGGIWTLVKFITKQQSYSDEVGILFTNMIRNFNYEGIIIHEVRFLHNFDFRPGKIKKAIQIFKNYDIIHLHTVFFPVFLAAILSNKKIIFTFHGLALPEKGAHLSFIDFIRILIIKHLFSYRVRVITTVSLSMQLLLEKYFKSLKDIKVIYNCTEFNENDFIWDENKSGKTLKILTYSRIVPSKRIEFVPEIIEILRTRKVNMQCDIYGEGETKHKIESLLVSKDLPIKLRNFTTSIKEVITNTDICVFPFKGETFGIAALEVLSIGKIPIVFEDGGGLVEIMKPIASGKFVVKDVMSCANLIEEIYRDRSIMVKYKQQIFERIREFRVEKIVAQYKLLYNNA
jgi:glycosyltransferase involved in cell wall biosynthesis